MAQGNQVDSRIVNFNLDMENEIALRQRMAEGAVQKPDDMLSGRADLNSQAVEEAPTPYVEEKLARDQSWARQASAEPHKPEPPEEVIARETDSRLSSMQDKLRQQNEELDKWKYVAKRHKADKLGLESRLRDLETRVNQVQPINDVRQMTGKNPDDILTAQEVTNLMLGLANVVGQQINGLRADVVKNVSRNTQVPEVDEAELVYTHPWLEQLPDAQRERAMLDIMATRNAGRPPAPEPPPQPTPRQTEAARSQVRDANYIETSNRANRTEFLAQEPQKAAAAQNIAKLQELLNKRGGADEAAKIFAALGAGIDDAESEYTRRR